jgi:hypothetical protein
MGIPWRGEAGQGGAAAAADIAKGVVQPQSLPLRASSAPLLATYYTLERTIASDGSLGEGRTQGDYQYRWRWAQRSDCCRNSVR